MAYANTRFNGIFFSKMSDIFSLHDLDDDVLDNLTESYMTNYSSFNGDFDFSSSPLCIPQDPIEDIDFFPSFVNKPISSRDLKDFDWCNEEVKIAENQIQTPSRVAFRDFDINGGGGGGFIGGKKQRSKREGKRAWSMKEVSFAAENEEPISGGDGGVSERRCSHCETTKTPQWRIGPLGPKTLCNACGVRYKSGRLLPEYRPAASPTFDCEKYSNFHRKILKKRGLMQ